MNINLDYYEFLSYNKISCRDNLWKLLNIKDKTELNILTND